MTQPSNIEPHTPRANHTALLWACVGVLCCLLLPISQSVLPPLADFPNHLARTYIAHHIGSEPTLHDTYVFEWRLLTNTLFDLLMAALIPWFGDLYSAGRAALCVYMCALVGGALALNRVLWGRWTYGPLLVALFAYNGSFIAGFYSFSLGSALALWAAAGWFMIQRQHAVLRLVYACLVTSLLYVFHLFAFGFFGLMVAGAATQELWRTVRQSSDDSMQPVSRLVILGLGALPAIALHLSTPHQASSGADVPTQLLGPVDNLVWPIHIPWVDQPVPLSAIGCVLLAYFVAKYPRTLHPQTTLAIGVLAVLGLACPEVVWDTSFVSPRFLILSCVLIAASWNGTFPDHRSTWRHPLAWTAIGLFVLSTTTNTLHWRRYDPIAREAIQMVRALPEGSRVEHLWNDRTRFGSSIWMNTENGERTLRVDPTRQILPPHIHIGSVAAVEANAFVPLLFTHRSKQLLRVSETFEHLDRTQGIPRRFVVIEAGLEAEQSVFAHPSLAPYDHVLTSFVPNFSDEQRRRLEQDVVSKGEWFWLLKNPNR